MANLRKKKYQATKRKAAAAAKADGAEAVKPVIKTGEKGEKKPVAVEKKEEKPVSEDKNAEDTESEASSASDVEMEEAAADAASDDEEVASDDEEDEEEKEGDDLSDGEEEKGSSSTLEAAPTADGVTDPYLLADADYIKKDPNWKNKQRTLVFASRGITGQHRHLMQDVKRLLPHHKSESKFEKNCDFKMLNEIAELKSCNNVMNMHTSGEVKMSGNCLLYSRPLLTFDANFEKMAHLRLTREMFIQTFGSPRNHPKTKPFHDHVMSFFWADNKIWVRHYQIAPLTDTDMDDPERQQLTEMGPRMVLAPVHILGGSFSGSKLYENPHYMTPTAARRDARAQQGVAAKAKMETKEKRKELLRSIREDNDEVDDIFGGEDSEE